MPVRARQKSQKKTNRWILLPGGLTFPRSNVCKRPATEHFDPAEFNLLHLFLLHPRQVLERGQILNDVWGYDFDGDDNVLEIYISYLRKKLENCGRPRLLQTVRGVGYVLREE